jgi:hypothetical protein
VAKPAATAAEVLVLLSSSLVLQLSDAPQTSAAVSVAYSDWQGVNPQRQCRYTLPSSLCFNLQQRGMLTSMGVQVFLTTACC